MDATQTVREKHEVLSGRLNEATLRLWAAAEARALGRGGVTTVAKASGLSRTTIYAGLRELDAPPTEQAQGSARIRTRGGGRKRLIDKDTALLSDLNTLVEPSTRGDPQSPLRWTCKSTPRLAEELRAKGHTVSQRTVCDLLAHLGYSLQATRRLHEGGHHDDRDAQFASIAARVAQYQRAGDPVIAVDTKKKELIGDFKNAGREWQPKGQPEAVRVYDFIDPDLGKVAPYV
jgi:transposase